MPPLPRLRVPALAELARQLRFQPARAARRQLEAAEAIVEQIEAERTYPEEWVIFRLTGFRPEAAATARTAGKGKRGGAGAGGGNDLSPTLIVGAALLADLPPLVERLCVAAGLTERDLLHSDGEAAGAGASGAATGGGSQEWLDAAALCERWGISRKTLDRYRRRGLIARRIIGPDSRHRLMFSRRAVERFEQRHAADLNAAAGFTRIDPGLEARIIRRAERYRRRLGCSLNQAAERLARRFDRSHEAVRQLLRRNDAESEDPIFDEPPPVRERERRVIERALAWGIETRTLAGRFRTTEAAVYRAIALRRMQRLRELDLSGPVGPGFEDAAAAERYLAHDSVCTGLGRGGPETLAELLDPLAERDAPAGPMVPKIEAARAAAYWFLRFDAARRIAGLSPLSPTSATVDAVETRLRWAARLKVELVRSQAPLVIKTIEGHLERPITTLPGAAARELVEAAIDALIDAIDRFDPFKGGRAAAPAGLALNRAVSQWLREAGPRALGGRAGGEGRAMPRADPAVVRLDDFARRVCAWQAWLEPDRRVRPLLARAPEPGRAIVAERYGWTLEGTPPRTLADLAAHSRVTPAQIVRRERGTIRALLAVARGQGPGGGDIANG